MNMTIRSDAFENGGWMPKEFTGEGLDVSPPLSWEGVPDSTKQFVLICDDPDAPTPEPWVHWVLYGIPPTTTSLPEALPPTGKLDMPSGALQGKNSWPHGATTGYRGPMPPEGHGVHHYHFRLYALNTTFDFQPALEKRTLLSAIARHVLAEAELVGTYER
jgi:Raf kinase inhibitor-like YbhB/YbcL family protein